MPRRCIERSSCTWWPAWWLLPPHNGSAFPWAHLTSPPPPFRTPRSRTGRRLCAEMGLPCRIYYTDMRIPASRWARAGSVCSSLPSGSCMTSLCRKAVFLRRPVKAGISPALWAQKAWRPFLLWGPCAAICTCSRCHCRHKMIQSWSVSRSKSFRLPPHPL